MKTNTIVRTAFAALVALGLAACSGPTLNGQSDFPGEPHVSRPTGPYDNTPNSMGGGFVGGGGDS